MPKQDLKSFFKELKANVVTNVETMKRPFFEPTGALEPAIVAIGTTTTIQTIVNVQCNNKSGKSALGAAVAANIIWDAELTYFKYKNFIQWPFRDEFGEIKHGRIVGSSKNVKDNGPIRMEILKWWPRGRYKEFKNGKDYFSLYETDNGWLIDVMTFNQAPKDFEGPVKSWHWIDEPSRAELMGAYTSRHYKGGIIWITQTPIGAAPMLDCLSDLKDGGTNVITIRSKLDDNSSETGLLNSTGTKRGLMTNLEIAAYKKTIPPDEYDARVNGKGSEKEGKVYKKFNRNVHVMDFDIDDRVFKQANCYMALDYHRKCYPFISWWAVLPPNVAGKNLYVCYNEWPRFETFGKYYDEIRKTLQFNMTYAQLVKICKMLDFEQYGYHIVNRGIDPYFESAKAVALEFGMLGMPLSIPKRERVEVKRNEARTLLEYDDNFGIENLTVYTQPQAFVMPHCRNMIRSLERHYWEDSENIKRNSRNTEIEAEKYKDPSDTFRIFLSLVGKNPYTPISNNFKNKNNLKRSSFKSLESEYLDKMAPINLAC